MLSLKVEVSLMVIAFSQDYRYKLLDDSCYRYPEAYGSTAICVEELRIGG